MPPYDQVPLPAAVNAFSVDGGTIYAGGCYNQSVIVPPRNGARQLANFIFSSTDGGSTWGKVDSGFSPKFYTTNDTGAALTSIYADGPHLVIGTKEWNPSAHTLTNTGIYHIIAQGGGWVLADSSLNSIQVSAIVGVKADVFAATASGVFHSSDHGSSWANISGGLADSTVSSLVISQGYLLAATASGVWKRALTEITSVAGNQASGWNPAGFALSQNYPNPFNPSTTIRYALPQSSHVSLTVFNTLGQLVATLVNGEVGPGEHAVTFNASNLSSGVYFYRIHAGELMKTKRLLLLR